MQETAQLIRFLGLSGIERADAGELSYGGQRLLDMGLALACAPRVLLLDEPLAGLAAAERERVAQLVKRISSDLPVLLVEHDIDRVFALADRVTVMNDGKVLFDGNAADARVQPGGARNLYRLWHRGAGRDGTRQCRAGGGACAAHARCGRCFLRQEPHHQECRRSLCTSTRSLRCSAATAPASRRC